MRSALVSAGLLLWLCGNAVCGEEPAQAPFAHSVVVQSVQPEIHDSADHVQNPFQISTSVDYLLWWLKPVCLKPVTLTLGNPNDAVPGALGQPGTQPLLGNHKFEFTGLSGIRPAIGVWFDADRSVGLEANGFVLENGTARESYHSTNGSPPLYLPYQNPENAHRALPFSVPGVVDGVSTGVGESQLWGVESNLVCAFAVERDCRVLDGALLLGLRYLNLRDRVTLSNLQSLVGNPSVFAFGQDNFTTRNQFLGAQIGAKLGLTNGPWSIELLTKLALGETHQVSEVAGQPLLAGSPLLPGLFPGPLLGLPSNIGRQSADRFTLVPEAAVTLRYELADYLSLSLGYSCLYWNKVLCPGDQMDGHVNISQLPGHGPVTGPRDPPPLFVHTDAFAHGLRAGIELRY